MNIGTKEKNITDWSGWFISMTIYRKLDISLFDNWMCSKGILHYFLLINQLQKSHTYDIIGLWVSVVTLFVSFVTSCVSPNLGLNWVALLTCIIITTTVVVVIYKKKNHLYEFVGLVYKFREEYEQLIRRLNLVEDQKDFSFETLENRARSILESIAETLTRNEDSKGRLSGDAEHCRKVFKEEHAFYQSFGLADDTYDPYFKQ